MRDVTVFICVLNRQSETDAASQTLDVLTSSKRFRSHRTYEIIGLSRASVVELPAVSAEFSTR